MFVCPSRSGNEEEDCGDPEWWEAAESCLGMDSQGPEQRSLPNDNSHLSLF